MCFAAQRDLFAQACLRRENPAISNWKRLYEYNPPSYSCSGLWVMLPSPRTMLQLDASARLSTLNDLLTSPRSSSSPPVCLSVWMPPRRDARDRRGPLGSRSVRRASRVPLSWRWMRSWRPLPWCCCAGRAQRTLGEMPRGGTSLPRGLVPSTPGTKISPMQPLYAPTLLS